MPVPLKSKLADAPESVQRVNVESKYLRVKTEISIHKQITSWFTYP